MTETLLWLIPLPPLLAFFIIVLFTHKRNALSHWLAIGAAGLSWLGGMIVFIQSLGVENLAEHPFRSTVAWLPTGSTALNIGISLDPLSAVTLFFVVWTVLMIFIYSVGYHNYGQPAGKADKPGLPPHGAEFKEHGHTHRVPSIEPMYARFFALISLFAFAMLLLVLTDNLLLLFVGWEIMGLCSYLLIGFWYARESARKAMIKAFLTTRVGDMFFLLGLAALYTITGSLSYTEILARPEVLMAISPVFGLPWAWLIAILMFCGVIGKSAQFPLHTWLPDAMEGPTPVSAMIHAATMVSAGVYLALRFFPLASLGWEAGAALTTPMVVMAVIGAFTALFAATIAVAQNDIKRVLAYSTISQLGFMIAALGVGAYVAAAFHLVMHAFFKALLFLGSGSVIHGMEHGVLHTGERIDPQDMYNMGGLRKKMPYTFWTFLIGGLALSGFPLVTAGFWSKDEILSGAFGGSTAVFVVLALAALLTAFYTARQITLTFLGKPRTQAAEHARESRGWMVGPLVVLAVFAVGAGWVGIPKTFPLLGGLSSNWFGGFVGSMLGEGEHEAAGSLIPLLTSLGVALGGLALGWLAYRGVKKATQWDPLRKGLGGIYTVLKNKYYVDEVYDRLFVRPSRWLAETFSYRWIDRGVLDGTLHGIGRFGLWLGRSLRRFFDIPVVNGTGDALADGTRGVGKMLTGMQSGRVQHYLLISLFGLLLIIGVFFYLVVMATA
jgi:NADH-quinone oxidoreductase subunit L